MADSRERGCGSWGSPCNVGVGYHMISDSVSGELRSPDSEGLKNFQLLATGHLCMLTSLTPSPALVIFGEKGCQTDLSPSCNLWVPLQVTLCSPRGETGVGNGIQDRCLHFALTFGFWPALQSRAQLVLMLQSLSGEQAAQGAVL